MTQLSRSSLLTSITTNVYQNIVNAITGTVMQNQLKNLADSCINILTDANVADGFVATDNDNQINQGYVVQQITVADLKALAGIDPVGTPSMVVLKQYYIDDAASGDRLLIVRAATSSTLFQQAYDMATGETGIYVLSTDKFTPIRAQYSQSSTAPTSSFDVDAGYAVGYRVERTTNGLVYICTDSTAGAAVWELDQSHVYKFRKQLNQANIYAAGYFDISECPAVAGYAWVCQKAQAQLSGSTTPYDGGSKVSVITDTAGTVQFSDVDNSLLAGSNSIGALVDSTILNQTYTSDMYVANNKLQVYLNSSSAAGDGTLTVFGTAVLIKTA